MASLLPFLYLADSPERGRGIFTAQEIPAGSIIELCPVLLIPAAQVPTIHQTVLHDYYFLWGEEGAAAIALGYGSLYNHSATPNADYEMELAENYLRIFARRDIEAGEEITISYTEGGAQRTKLWFEPR
jgi:SET domain-containing protein